MASALMAWVWIFLTLAQLNNAESPRYAHGRVAGPEQRFEGAPVGLTDQNFTTPVWHFLRGSGKKSDFNRPQYHCSDGVLSLRFSLIRYSNIRMEDGTPLLSLPEECGSYIQFYRSWLLVKLPDTECYTATEYEDGLNPLKLHYFDRILKTNMMGTAVCETPAISPLVTCKKQHILVKLPPEAKLKKVKEFDIFTNEDYSVKRQKTPSALFVKISRLPGKDSGFEVVYGDSTGKLCTVLAACSSMSPKKVVKRRVRRSLDEPFEELWDFDDIPPEPYTGIEVVPGEPAVPGGPVVPGGPEEPGIPGLPFPNMQVFNSTEIAEEWGVEKIPEEPYTGIDVEMTASTTPTTGTSTSTVPATTSTATTTTTASTTTTSQTVPTTTVASTTTATAPTTTTATAPTTTTTTAPTTTTVAAPTTRTTAPTTTRTTAPTTTTTTAPTTTTTTAPTTTTTTAQTTTTTTAPTTTTTTTTAPTTTAPTTTTTPTAPTTTTTPTAPTTTTTPTAPTAPTTTAPTTTTTTAPPTTTTTTAPPTTTTTTAPPTTTTTTAPPTTTTTTAPPTTTTTTAASTTTTTTAPPTTTTPMTTTIATTTPPSTTNAYSTSQGPWTISFTGNYPSTTWAGSTRRPRSTSVPIP